MTSHVAPPGDWQPPEPPWMKDARECVVQIRKQVDRHIRAHKIGFLVWLSGGILGQLVGNGLVWLIQWKTGLK